MRYKQEIQFIFTNSALQIADMLRRTPLYVSYYTIGNGYEAEAAELLRTLEIHNLPHRVIGIQPDLTDLSWTWQRATQFKAEYIRDIKRSNPDRAIVWLDADARVMQRPRLFDWLRCDLAAHWHRHRELLSGTLYFGPGNATLPLLEEWIERNTTKNASRCAEKRNLNDVLRRYRGLIVVNLPPEYAWIDSGSGNDTSARVYGQRHAVIVHTQASRRLRNAKR